MKKFKKYISFILLFSFILSFSFDFNHIFAQSNKNFKIVGYSTDIFNDPIEKNIQFDKVTHLIYGFLIPSGDGPLLPPKKTEQLKSLVENSHKHNVKVSIAIGGWFDETGNALDPRFEKIASSDALRKKLVDSILTTVDTYKVDGVEIDWEYPDIGESSKNYEKLILELSDKLKPKGKYLTAALNGAWSKTEGPEVSKAVTDKCLKAFDWINVMSYDTNNQDHSPFSHADTSIQYWINRGVPKDKIVIGVPFYAQPNYMQYRDLVKENKENAYKDMTTIGSTNHYYNGINTIKEKTRLALKNAGGIMVFDINEDTLDDTSLVKAINDTVIEYSSMNPMEFNNTIHLLLNNKELTFSKDENMGMPFIDTNNRTLIPVRKPLEAIGATVNFDNENNIVTAIKDDIIVQIPIGKDYIKVNNIEVKMDTISTIKNQRTYIPLKYVFESFNYKVTWHENSKTVIIKNK